MNLKNAEVSFFNIFINYFNAPSRTGKSLPQKREAIKSY